jgi:hypothetical protein
MTADSPATLKISEQAVSQMSQAMHPWVIQTFFTASFVGIILT